ncbi:MAG: hypothetical protein GXN91_05285, partial [Epsilonproteobacteria bacterium]|nr:hypothetical protein [Campylobacterota bacterium]
ELETIEKALNYLQQNSKWTKSIILTPPKTKLQSPTNPIWVENSTQAKEILKKEYFNYAFCYGLNQEEILQNITNHTLFT